MQYTSSYNLYSLLLNQIFTPVRSLFVKPEKPEFPQRIGEYFFVGYFKKIGPRKSYPLAIYETSNGEKAIAKMINARIKGYHYYSLANEITMYKALNSAIERLGNKMPERFKSIYIPKLFYVYEDKKVLVSLVEFVNGKVAEDLSPEEKIPLFFNMVEFIQFIGNQFMPAEKKQISKRTYIHYLFLYPILVLKSMITYPHAIPYILLSIPAFIRCMPAMIKDSKTTLVHRDLHFMNMILLDKGGVALVDFQQCVYTEPLHEVITILRYWWKGWKSEKFGQLLMKEIIKRYGKRKNFKKLFRGYAINSVTHGLTGKGFSSKIINGWIDFLRFSTNPDFEEYEN